ncbi:hypothetical protein E2C01_081617 [Portunus trituberculatus]|uniref:Uncharacterized protein n=1 Tax=Portunus trituberculatus TaxID=210409 RepID=A0A5B7IX24_PORTR|nr:hypothetical protein [Portunus trituberculatus]
MVLSDPCGLAVVMVVEVDSICRRRASELNKRDSRMVYISVGDAGRSAVLQRRLGSRLRCEGDNHGFAGRVGSTARAHSDIAWRVRCCQVAGGGRRAALAVNWLGGAGDPPLHLSWLSPSPARRRQRSHGYCYSSCGGVCAVGVSDTHDGAGMWVQVYSVFARVPTGAQRP